MSPLHFTQFKSMSFPIVRWRSNVRQSALTYLSVSVLVAAVPPPSGRAKKNPRPPLGGRGQARLGGRQGRGPPETEAAGREAYMQVCPTVASPTLVSAMSPSPFRSRPTVVSSKVSALSPSPFRSRPGVQVSVG